MSISIQQLKALSFGYLCGNDLTGFCPYQLLQKQYEVDPNSLNQGAETAIEEIVASLRTRYDLTTELAKIAFTPAQATAVLTGGVVTSITINSGGTNYGTPPTVSFVGSPGSGAAATATLTNGVVTGFTITNGGSGYVQPPTVGFTGGAAADTRLKLLVKIASIISIRNILGNAQNISDYMTNWFMWADRTLKDMRNGQMNLLAIQADPVNVSSPGELVDSSFNTLG